MSDDTDPELVETIARRAALVARVQAQTGIDEVMIRTLVHAFYDRVRSDPLIGPVFAAKITDWAPHLARMCDFWSSVTLMSGRYHGRPLPKHAFLPIDGTHFDRWLTLFGETARDVCPPAAAQHFLMRARMIAESFELAIANHRGHMLAKGERLPPSAPVE